ncbi:MULTISPECIES: hypothetical protein [Okeania]|uniref:Uncharacterized protein n=1 Tax=Okeania hirsuta TaxID=1458930 RepID=A0A3N6RFR9_9CYAN|nr:MULTISPECIES: hypothetical protein [Okeania]NET11599.1 hypothetical protein [Okeania sp. SIO1H6]NES74349.1 hypothetical protein [Okeania sp. SIO1H4]NES87945.1 hypothetical protein [Okeania sp. SIO2B9]NET18370.1 hypothetical protein [Okeania sp. SIO1H5]NET75982.1 hypothetical protein [Okeania sp. SIO1F9]
MNHLPAIAKSATNLEEFQQKLAKLDLEPIIFKITHPKEDKGWTLEKADRVAELYKQFLTLMFLCPNAEVLPTTEIDDFWHYHILDTALRS